MYEIEIYKYLTHGHRVFKILFKRKIMLKTIFNVTSFHHHWTKFLKNAAQCPGMHACHSRLRPKSAEDQHVKNYPRQTVGIFNCPKV